MKSFTRRAGLAMVVGALAAGGVAAQEKAAAPPPLKSVFKYLDAYLKIPAADRDKFTLAYYMRAPGGGGPPPGVRLYAVSGGQRTPLSVAANGRVEHPSLAMLNSKATFAVDKPSPNVKLNFNMALEPTARPATQMNAAELASAVDQSNRGIRKAAGVIGLVAPKMASVRGVGGGSGEVVLADGKRAPLPVIGGAPTFMPASFPGARTVVFATTPSRLELAPAPKAKK